MARKGLSTGRGGGGRRPGSFIAVLALLAALAGGWWATQEGGPLGPGQATGETAVTTPAPPPPPAVEPRALPDDPAAWPLGARRIPYPQDSERFVEISRTLDRIESGGPYPYDRDDITFQNREGLLPDSDYREYTVVTPGLSHRGARRVVVDQESGVAWYTDDHYDSFDPVARVRLP